MMSEKTANLPRVFGMVIIPFLAFLFFATFFIHSNLDEMNQAAAISVNTLMWEAASQLLHQIQRERSTSGLFSQKRLPVEVLQKQQQATNETLGNFRNRISDFGLAEDVASAAREISSAIPRVRSQLLDENSKANGYEAYSQIISILLEMERSLLNRTTNLEAGVFFSSILLVESARELTGRLHARLSALLTEGKPLTEDETLLVLGAYSAIEPLLEILSMNLSPTGQAFLNMKRMSQPWHLLNETIHKIFRNSHEGKFDIDPNVSFQSISQVVDDLESIIKLQIHDVRIIQTKLYFEARNKVTRMAGFIAVISLYLIVFGFTYVRNLRRQEQDAEAIEKLSRQNELILSSAAEGIIGFDHEGNMTFVNEAAAQMLGYSVENLLRTGNRHLSWHHSRRDGSLYSIEDCPIQRTWKNGETCRRDDEVFWRKDGTSFDVEYVCAPKLQKGKPVGAVLVFRDISERKIVDLQLKKALEDVREAREQEAAAGYQIQQALLFGRPPEIPGILVDSITIPSAGIDGDFFDFFMHDSRVFDVLFGDVMGKGIPAALIGAAAKSHFQKAMARLLLPIHRSCAPSPEELVNEVDKVMRSPLSQVESFISLHYCRFDLERNCLDLVNCGHTPVIHFQKESGECRLVDSTYPPLGIEDGEKIFRQQSINFASGDLILFYSDGMTEARNASGEFFGLNRLLALICANPHSTPSQLTETIYNELKTFTGRKTFQDDLTCVAVKLLPS